ncbi:hypothetical protein [Caballeronia sp. BR00000012568055]|uniref:hypothetical protein n=1 Tax=Caballeronia sp. BR00000012568055 TaxID=2918761 RepID=UPI0023F65DDB|nr:hypothetical protein [Caballeronia sp. BR00000012568055]
MDTVSAMNQVLGLLRQELIQRDRAGRNADARAGLRHTEASKTGNAKSTLLTQIAELKGHGISDTDSAIRYVVESLLGQEFGHAMRNDPEFQRMVDEVHHALLESESARSLFNSL